LLAIFTHRNCDVLEKIREYQNNMKTLVFSFFLTLVAAAVAVDLDGVENEITTTTTAAVPHAHIRGANDGSFNELSEQEVIHPSCRGGTTEPDLGKRCEDDSDCKNIYRCGQLFCVKHSPYDLFGRCAYESHHPLCYEQGEYCEKDYECCGSYKCDGSICIRETNEGYCRPQGGSCRVDTQCCGSLACIRSRCSGTATTCKKPGGYCEQDYGCCDDLECGVSHHCVRVNQPCRTQGQFCVDDHAYLPEFDQENIHEADCCDGWKCQGSRCVKAGRSQCKLLDDYCDDLDQCCGDLICDGVTSTCTNRASPSTCLEEKTGDFCTSFRDCDCDGMRCVKNSCCRAEGQPCAKADECCRLMECANRKCIDKGPPVIECTNKLQYGERCLRTDDCCPPMHCRSNACR
jgi:hypothetical protein